MKILTPYDKLLARLGNEPRVWLITGVAGFIGSNLLEALLGANQAVIGLDNFSTGKQRNLDEVVQAVTPAQRARFKFIQGDISDLETCRRACQGADYVLHQAALGSVPRSIEDPLRTNESNVTGFLNMIEAARQERVKRFVYASSSSIYGDAPELPKVEHKVGRPLSPYAVTKMINELYADVFSLVYGLETIGLRYFNVFGPRQDPAGQYAAVIPRWIAAMIQGEPAVIHGDGGTSRDFCYVANVVQANLLAATCSNPAAIGQKFNVALNDRATLLELFEMIRGRLLPAYPHLNGYKPQHLPFRAGDILHSQADITQAKKLLGYEPTHAVADGLDASLGWYKENHHSLLSSVK
jgi:UDP-N-acetylglucosamine 4-epimerase